MPDARCLPRRPHHRVFIRDRRGDGPTPAAAGVACLRHRPASPSHSLALEAIGCRILPLDVEDEVSMHAGGRDHHPRGGRHRRPGEQRGVLAVGPDRDDRDESGAPAVRDQRVRPGAPHATGPARHAGPPPGPYRQHRVDGRPPDVPGRRDLSRDQARARGDLGCPAVRGRRVRYPRGAGAARPHPHALREGRQRQPRGPGGRPGRPVWQIHRGSRANHARIVRAGVPWRPSLASAEAVAEVVERALVGRANPGRDTG